MTFLASWFLLAGEILWLQGDRSLTCDRFEQKAQTVLIYRNQQVFSLHADHIDWSKTHKSAHGDVQAPNNRQTSGVEPPVETISPDEASTTSGLMIQKLSAKDAGLIDLLRFMADMADINLVIDSSVPDTKATYHFKNIPWEQAFQVILRNAGLDCETLYGAIRIRK